MLLLRFASPTAILLACVFGSLTAAQDAHHHHGSPPTATEPVAAPKIFLDKSPRIVAYQLGRLDNTRLLLVERKPDDKKYAPVYAAILSRAGMSPQYREEALDALVAIHGSDAATELLAALADMKATDQQSRRTATRLARLLLRQPQPLLQAKAAELEAATDAESALMRSVGHAGLIVALRAPLAWQKAESNESATLDWLAAVSLVPSQQVRGELREQVEQLVAGPSPAVSRAAIRSLSFIAADQEATFKRIAPLVADKSLRDAAVSTLLKVPAEHRDAETSRTVVETLVDLAESTPPADRTSDNFLNAMQLGDQLLARLPVETARSYRKRLSEITVRVVRIHTVEEEMRYDLPYFAVEAGRPVQVVLQNEDLMPHNLVVTSPGALKEVAELGLAAGPTGGLDGKQYVPHSDKVLYATDMVQPRQQARLTFTAPTTPGEYPYVCTFPRHWMRMYGVMVVVEDLDAWLQDPVEPKDPVGSNRSFVQSWKPQDLNDQLADGLRGRSAEIGQRIFTEATCALCHKIKGVGGAVGPDLTDVFKRWKGDAAAVLREILEPSHRIEPKYAVHLIVTDDGQTLSGIVTAEDKSSISLLANPEAKQPLVIKRSEIDEMVKTSTSMMPKALLDRFTKDEIFELLGYLQTQ